MEEYQLRLQILALVMDKQDVIPKTGNVLDADKIITIVDKFDSYVTNGREGKLKLI